MECTVRNLGQPGCVLYGTGPDQGWRGCRCELPRARPLKGFDVDRLAQPVLASVRRQDHFSPLLHASRLALGPVRFEVRRISHQYEACKDMIRSELDFNHLERL